MFNSNTKSNIPINSNLHLVSFVVKALAPGGHRYMEIKVGDNHLFLSGTDWSSTSDLVEVQVFKNPTSDQGSKFPILPYNGVKTKTAFKTLATSNPSIKDEGKLLEYL
jgi:hypothetical protein